MHYWDDLRVFFDYFLVSQRRIIYVVETTTTTEKSWRNHFFPFHSSVPFFVYCFVRTENGCNRILTRSIRIDRQASYIIRTNIRLSVVVIVRFLIFKTTAEILFTIFTEAMNRHTQTQSGVNRCLLFICCAVVVSIAISLPWKYYAIRIYVVTSSSLMALSFNTLLRLLLLLAIINKCASWPKYFVTQFNWYSCMRTVRARARTPLRFLVGAGQWVRDNERQSENWRSQNVWCGRVRPIVHLISRSCVQIEILCGNFCGWTMTMLLDSVDADFISS